MHTDPIKPGDLLAYLDGVALPHVEQALQASAELRQELEQLRRMDHRLRQLLGGLPVPEPQDLVDVATGQATPAQQLRVAAYARSHPRAKEALTALLDLQAEPTRRSGRFRLPRFAALPQLLGAGVRRGLADATSDQSFYASELAAQVVLRISPPEHDRWRIEGYVTQQDQPAPGIRVTLRGDHGRVRTRVTDDEGFFHFAQLVTGSYIVQAHFPQGIVLVPAITLAYA